MPGAQRPTTGSGRAGAEQPDPRIAAVLEVLGGGRLEEVAAAWSVEVALLRRWVTAFVEAGTAQVTNRPVGELARQRDRFLTAFMHGLRSPLAEAQGWVGLLHDAVGAGPTGDLVARLQGSLDLLNDRALDVELLTAALLGRLSLQTSPVRVADLTAQLVSPDAVGGEGPDVVLTVDPGLFSRILRDLWGAATALPAPRTAHLEVETVPPWVEVRVVRDGGPLDPAAVHSMFEPFEAPAEDATPVPVTAGLYLARALTVVHGGTLGVHEVGRHTVFWVRVPDAREDPSHAPDPPDPTRGDP